MSFLNPALLFGMGAVAVPIVIHLFSRRKVKHVRWAAMRFLRNSLQKTRKRLRLEDLLLLALRCLILLLLALALARPIIPTTGGSFLGLADTSAVIVIDVSYSMGQTDGVNTRLQKARDAAEQVLDGLPTGSRVGLFLAGDATVDRLIAAPTADHTVVRRQIQQFEPTDQGTALMPAYTAALDRLRQDGGMREIYVISDGQRVGWSPPQTWTHTMASAAEEGIRTHLIFVGEKPEPNLGITNVSVDADIVQAERPSGINVEVANYGTQEATDVSVSLRVDAEPATAQANIPRIAPGSRASVRIEAIIPTTGTHAVTATISPDRVPADDSRSLGVEVARTVDVLIVDGYPGQEARDSASFYLRNALVPVLAERRDDYLIQARVVSPDGLGGEALSRYAAIVLTDVSRLGDAETGKLAGFVENGGGLVIFPGPQADLAWYNDVLANRYGLLPARLGVPEGDTESAEPVARLDSGEQRHPIATIWNDAASGDLSTALFFKVYPLDMLPQPKGEPVEGADDAPAGPISTVLDYQGGKPAILERRWGKGTVLLFSSTADTRWNDWPVRLSFLPLVHRTLGHLLHGRDQRLNMPVGGAFTMIAPDNWAGREAVVELMHPRPGQPEYNIPRSVETRDGRPRVETSSLLQSGAYRVSVDGGGTPPAWFAVQSDPEESELEPVSVAGTEEMETVAGLTRWEPGATLDRDLANARIGVEFWWTLALLALLAGVAETLLAQRFSESK